MIAGIIIAGAAALIGLSGIRVIQQTEKGLVETFGKFTRYAEPGFNWIIPIAQRMRKVDVTENMVDAKKQQIITKDKLNAAVDAQVYFKVKSTEEGVKASQYKVSDYEWQIVNLARTTLRNIIGGMTLTDANSKRDTINHELMKVLQKETSNWGIEVVRTELKEIDPPEDVQRTMNKVVMAENEKVAATDFATATETKADGEKRAEIKRAEGLKAAAILEAQGKAEAFKLVNKEFKGNAQTLKKLEVTENCLKNNSKIVLPEGKSLVNVMGSLAGDK